MPGGTLRTTKGWWEMTNYPFEDPVTVRELDRSALEDLLRKFEDVWAAESGARITSAEFYDRYARGEIDSTFAMAWATYYESFRRLGDDDATTAIVETLVAS